MKYIIKNCPAKIFMFAEEMKCGEYGSSCKDITDCLLKQIVEKCKEEWDLRPDMNIDDNFPKEVLQLLEIEECE